MASTGVPTGEPPVPTIIIGAIEVMWSWEEVRLSVAVLIFCGFIALDTYRAFKKKAIWIQPGALALSALSIQLLGFLNNSNVDIGDYPSIQKYDLRILLHRNLEVDAGRVIVCIYMAYLLPSMACSEDNGIKLWSDMGALAISLGSHTISELYVFIEFYEQRDELGINPSSIVFRLCVMVCTILLFLFLASAAFAGRTLYNMVLEKIPLALPKELDPFPVMTEEVMREKMEDIKHHVLQSWLVVWVSKPDYVIARSVLSSALGVVITICALFYGVEYITVDYESTHFHDGIDWLRYTTTGLECLLIVEGGFVILWRWITSVYYNQRSWNFFLDVEDFWTRHVFEMIDSIEYRRRQSWEQQVSSGNFLGHWKLQICSFLFLHKWLLPLFIWIQILTVWVSKGCCFVSQVIVVVLCKLRVLERIDVKFQKASQKLTPPAETSETLQAETQRFMQKGGKKALETLLMPGETPEMLWTATQKAFIETKRFMQKGVKDAIPEEVMEKGGKDGIPEEAMEKGGKDGIPPKKKLVELMSNCSSNQRSAGEMFLVCLEQTDGLPVEKDFINLKKLSFKMTVLSLIRLMKELGAPWDSLSNLLDAYEGAQEFLDLLDHHDFSVFTNVADKEFALLKRCVEEGRSTEIKKGKQPLETIKHLKDTIQINYTEKDSVGWWLAASRNSLYKVCTAIYNDNQNGKTISETIDLKSMESLLGDVIFVKLLEAGKKLAGYCREWAKEMEDEKIRAAVYITGKLDGVMQAFEAGRNV